MRARASATAVIFLCFIFEDVNLAAFAVRKHSGADFGAFHDGAAHLQIIFIADQQHFGVIDNASRFHGQTIHQNLGTFFYAVLFTRYTNNRKHDIFSGFSLK
jgi:hypothetical protein